LIRVPNPKGWAGVNLACGLERETRRTAVAIGERRGRRALVGEKKREERRSPPLPSASPVLSGSSSPWIPHAEVSALLRLYFLRGFPGCFPA
jgi:hypothetical protein